MEEFMSSRICDRCKHLLADAAGAEFCQTAFGNVDIGRGPFTPIDEAREICDREGDGRFVYFEPSDEPQPSAGASFVQITRAAVAGAK